jgi:hypothetical protein
MTKPDPQNQPTQPLFRNVFRYGNEVPQQIQLGLKGSYSGIPFQGTREPVMNRYLHHQQGQLTKLESHRPGRPVTPGSLQEQTYAAYNGSPDGLFHGHSVNGSPFLKPEHGPTPTSVGLQ